MSDKRFYAVIGKFNGFFRKIGNDIVKYRYIGQVKIENIRRDDVKLFRLHVESVYASKRMDFHLEFKPELESKGLVYALLTLPKNCEHKIAIDHFDERQFNGRRLRCKPNGFTNNSETDDYERLDFSDQKAWVDEFLYRFYPGMRRENPPALMSIVPTTSGPEKRKKITHSESNDSLLQTIVAKEIKVEADDDGWEPAGIKREPDIPSTSSETNEAAVICDILKGIRAKSLIEPTIEEPQLEAAAPEDEEILVANWERQVICCDCGRAMPWFHIVEHGCSRKRPDYLN